MSVPEEVSTILSGACQEPDSIGRHLPDVYSELRALADRYMRSERAGHTLQPTALVHEAYLKLSGQDRIRWKGRTHLLGVAAQAMRRILVDHARGRHRQKRGGRNEPLPLDEAIDRPITLSGDHSIDLLDLDEALAALAQNDPRKAEVVELMYFAGLTAAEAAEVLGVTARTVERDWRYARAWLFDRLTERDD